MPAGPIEPSGSRRSRLPWSLQPRRRPGEALWRSRLKMASGSSRPPVTAIDGPPVTKRSSMSSWPRCPTPRSPSSPSIRAGQPCHHPPPNGQPTQSLWAIPRLARWAAGGRRRVLLLQSCLWAGHYGRRLSSRVDTGRTAARPHASRTWTAGDQAAATPDRCDRRPAMVGCHIRGSAPSEQFEPSVTEPTPYRSVDRPAGTARRAWGPCCLPGVRPCLPPDGLTGHAVPPDGDRFGLPCGHPRHARGSPAASGTERADGRPDRIGPRTRSVTLHSKPPAVVGASSSS